MIITMKFACYLFGPSLGEVSDFVERGIGVAFLSVENRINKKGQNSASGVSPNALNLLLCSGNVIFLQIL